MTKKKPDPLTSVEFQEQLEAEQVDYIYPLSCDGHTHIPWARNGFDQQTIILGRICRIPDNGNILEIKKRSTGITKVTYEPSTGRTLREGF